MITRDQAITANEFHTKRAAYSPHPRHKYRACITWRRNGKTTLWKTRPEWFRAPVKYGLYAYGAVSHMNASEFYVPEECPYCRKDGDA